MGKIKVLFQGDSITDMYRGREDFTNFGIGYPTFLIGKLTADYPNRFAFANRAVSGNRVVDLYARWRADAIALKPDIISILIGINDVWHEISSGNGVEADRYEQVYDMLLEYTRDCIPGVRFILMEPFVLRQKATDAAWETFQKETAQRAAAVRRLAEKYGACFVPLQQMFDDACHRAEAGHWLADGVHPTAAGHVLIARQWLRFVGTMLGVSGRENT